MRTSPPARRLSGYAISAHRTPVFFGFSLTPSLRMTSALAACLIAVPAPLAAFASQAPSAAAQAATQSLLERADTLEARGRLDMAAQVWQQVLLTDPNNTAALAGLARSAKLSGNAPLANTYLDRLRAINPHDPNIARIQSMLTQQGQSAQLAQAGKYAAAGQYRQAMEIYRQLFGGDPPAGDWALAYYETESATEDGRPHAIAGLRSLIRRYPTDARYQVALGRILTYAPRTRAEGRALLAHHLADSSAAEAYRQSLLWDAQTPSAAPEIRAYLAAHTDTQLANAFKNQPKSGKRALTAAERREQVFNAQIELAFHALNAQHIPDAEQRFRTLLTSAPDNPRALAGMGYVRMQQSNFSGAISFLEQAKQDGAHDPGLEAALSAARFYSTLAQAAAALQDDDLPTAEKQYRLALAMRPADPDALEGLGGTLLKADQPVPAIEVFTRYTQVKASAAPAWRGLFMAQSNAGRIPEALATDQRVPAAAHAQLLKDPDYLRNLAGAYTAVGRDADAQRILNLALDLPFPADSRTLKADTQLQYAALLQQANHLDQSAGLYRQILAADPSNAAAWQGLIRVDHAMMRDTEALETLDSMPATLRDQAMRDAGFDATVAAIYQAQHKLVLAQSVLESAIARQSGLSQPRNALLQTQLAGIYVAEKNVPLAVPLYHAVLEANPADLDAWKGLLNALHVAGRDREAFAELHKVPSITRRLLEEDVDYLQTVANIYNALNQPHQAAVYLRRIQQHYADLRHNPPADIDIQSAYLFFNAANDPALYRQLMSLGGRTDLTDEQRRTVQTIWSLWAVRRANQAAALGDDHQALAILNAAAASFPNNPAVARYLASGYTAAGQPTHAVAIFKSQSLTSAADYKAAIGSALAANDLADADTWFRAALALYPHDAQLLALGAKLAQASGDFNRAAAYYRASLAALPPAGSAAELAAELARPAPVSALLPSAAHPQSLAALLAPGKSVPFAEPAAPANAAHPYLPAYRPEDPLPPLENFADQAPAGANELAVPAYMASPTTQAGIHTLKDYVPLANPSQPTGGYTIPQIQNQSIPAPAAYQNQQIRQLTEQAQSTQQQGTLASPEHPDVVYGPYVPYTPGTTPQTTAQASTAQQYPQPDHIPTRRPPATASEALQPLAPETPAPQPILTAAAPLGPPIPLVNSADLDRSSQRSLLRRPTERQETELDLGLLEGSLSSSFAESPYVRRRSGTPGFDQLIDFEAPAEASIVANRSVRITAVANPVYMTNGTVDTAHLAASTGTVPILGTLPGTAATPLQQSAGGLGGELQFATNHLDASAGYTPFEFLVPNITGHLRVRPLGRYLTLYGDRDSIKETQLSYAGLHDPGTASSTTAGNVWGGVVSTGGGARLDLGGARGGFYLSGDAANITGQHTLANHKLQATAGTYIRVKKWRDVGTLNVGANAFGMHYANNQLGLTYGTGGYFSPQSYFQFAVPVTFDGHHGSNLHYSVGGSVGIQRFHSDFAPYYPIDTFLETAAAGAGYAASTSTGVNYAANGQLSYRLNPHWYTGGFVTANNSNDYDSFTGGFFLRYLIKPQPTPETPEEAPTGLFPNEGIRPLRNP